MIQNVMHLNETTSHKHLINTDDTTCHVHGSYTISYDTTCNIHGCYTTCHIHGSYTISHPSHTTPLIQHLSYNPSHTPLIQPLSHPSHTRPASHDALVPYDGISRIGHDSMPWLIHLGKRLSTCVPWLMCAMTHVCHDSCVPWLMCAITHVCHDSCVPSLMCAMTHVCHDSCVPWLMCAMTHVCHDSSTWVTRRMHTCMTCIIDSCDMTHTCVQSYVWYDAWMCAILGVLSRINVCHMTHCAPERPIHMCDKIQVYVWQMSRCIICALKMYHVTHTHTHTHTHAQERTNRTLVRTIVI